MINDHINFWIIGWERVLPGKNISYMFSDSVGPVLRMVGHNLMKLNLVPKYNFQFHKYPL